ncbi:MAG: 3-phosphoshikimate 1-carboxyvinyltransferase [Bacteroidales bacterium]|nr:3-phosphoshikimate 1-carboxyvinyltransferase [Bacteroidales bacterium]
MKYKISKSNKKLRGELKVASSKSISNRLLIIRALSERPFQLINLSESEDTRVLQQALESNQAVVDIGHAGTAMRFLTAYFANSDRDVVLTGSDRMKQRPIGNLVKALQELGAEIRYLEKEGFPPLYIHGKRLEGGEVKIDGSISSQFISALLMVAPTFKNGLKLELENQIISSDYIQMTMKIMKQAGVNVESDERLLVVKPQFYQAKDMIIEGDWSGVSYWYEAAAFAEESEIHILSLQQNSVQGDSRCAQIFEHLGIETQYTAEGIVISKKGKLPSRFDYDFVNNPDLVQTLAVTCVMLDVPFRFTGTQSLRIKETDRIQALQNELKKFGAHLVYIENGILEWDGTKTAKQEDSIIISTYEDHRMAMAFAPIAILNNNIIIENPKVVAKSYPNFWNDMQIMGFRIEEMS